MDKHTHNIKFHLRAVIPLEAMYLPYAVLSEAASDFLIAAKISLVKAIAFFLSALSFAVGYAPLL
jgi:hypothetical protein